jgi:multiple sugar transport system substrate-binding protein
MEYRTAEMPAPKDGVQHAGYSNGNFMIIPRGAKSVDGAWDFIKFWSGIKDPERAAKFYTMGGWLPLDPRVANAKAYQAYLTKYPQFRTFLKVLESPKVQPAPPVPYQMFLQDRIYKYQDLAYRGTLTPEQALITLEKDVNHEVTRRKELGYGE